MMGTETEVIFALSVEVKFTISPVYVCESSYMYAKVLASYIEIKGRTGDTGNGPSLRFVRTVGETAPPPDQAGSRGRVSVPSVQSV